MNNSIKKAINYNQVKSFLKVSALTVFGMSNVKAVMSETTVALVTVGALFLIVFVAAIWGKFGSGNEA